MRLRCFPFSRHFSPLHPPGWRYGLFTPTAVILGGVLVIAAALKLWSLHQGYDALQFQPIHSPSLMLLAACAELFVGLCLLSGIAPAWSRVAGLSLFIILCAVALSEFAQGTPSCGCFGRLRTAPLEMAAFDGLAVIALALLRLPARQRRFRPAMSRMLFTSVLAASGFAAILFSMGGKETIAPASTFVIVNASDWVGKPFPLSKVLDQQSQRLISLERAEVIFYDHCCPECRAIIEGMTRRPHGRVPPSDIFSLDVAAWRSNDHCPRFSSPFRELVLSEGVRVSADVPLVVVLSRGIVQSAGRG